MYPTNSLHLFNKSCNEQFWADNGTAMVVGKCHKLVEYQAFLISACKPIALSYCGADFFACCHADLPRHGVHRIDTVMVLFATWKILLYHKNRDKYLHGRNEEQRCKPL